MRTGKFQIMMGKPKKANFNDLMGNNSKRFISKNMRRLGGNEYYQMSKSTNMNPMKNFQLKQYIDMTVTHFTVKCTLLCNEIEEMKKEFVTQLQGIIEGFQFNEPSYPLIKGGFNKNLQNLNYNKINLDNGYVNTNLIDQYKSNSNSNFNNSKEKYYLNNIDGMDLNYEKHKKHANSDIENANTEKLNKDSSFVKINVRDTNNKHRRDNSKNYQDKVLPQIKSIQKVKMKSSKEKVFKILMKSKVLSFDDKLKIRFLNQSMFNDYNTKDILKKSKNEYENDLSKLSSENKDLPTLTSTSTLNFITKEKENELKDESKDINKKFFNFIFMLSDKKNDSNSSLENQYKNFCNELKVNSIKEFIINYMKKVRDSIKDINDEVINNIIKYLENNKELIEHKADKSQLINIFSFSINELYEIFIYEKTKRERIKILQNLINKIKSIEKKLNK